ncbi:type II toxin-antitoxin system Phd/YefM family antitoxin [Paracoccus laeviglucosivorans]|uniref:Antitoxin n=1 Tax=Paracoccus laeviglucosivorans TaxID=1197861 RepID=A0A521B6X3_9RHOB|nr:type II toxin-antitoxin system Phd/YefM family antitoxin [Paracoccus laeviglucosivorans]SMO42852.1 prevent-host-death family protein [Paracoccus laeviglucosivorans]
MWTLQDAKNRFSAVVDAALAGQPQEVTRRGKPAVVVLSAAEYARMRDAAAENRGSFISHLLNFPGEPDAPRNTVTPRDVNF